MSLSRAPVEPPDTPTEPVSSGNINHDNRSPFAVRCNPQPWWIAHGFAVPISRPSLTMVSTGIPVILEAHSGVFSTPSSPKPRM